MKFRLKPKEVEAFEFTGVESYREMCARFGEFFSHVVKYGEGAQKGVPQLVVSDMLVGDRIVHRGDFVMEGDRPNSFTVIGREHFLSKYEEVNDAEPESCKE